MTDTGAGDPLAIMVPCDRCQAPHQYGERCEYCGYLREPEWFLTGSHYPTRPCLRCGSRDHDDCGGKR